MNEDQEKNHNESKFSTPNFKEFSSHKKQMFGLDTYSVFQIPCIKSSSVYTPREFQEHPLGKAKRELEIFKCCSLVCKKLDFMTTKEVVALISSRPEKWARSSWSCYEKSISTDLLVREILPIHLQAVSSMCRTPLSGQCRIAICLPFNTPGREC